MSRFDHATQVLVYLSVPKTGSSSLTRMLTEVFGPEHVAQLPDRQVDAFNHGWRRVHDQFRRMSMRTVNRITGKDKKAFAARFLHGHHPLWAPLPTRRSPVFITMFRAPVDRFLSTYFYIRQKAEAMTQMNALKQRVLATDPDDYARRVMGSPAARRLNGQCLYMARDGSFAAARAALEQRLSDFASLEDLPDFARRLSDFLGCDELPVQRVNVARHPGRDTSLSPKVEDALRAALSDDLRLYDFVQERAQRGAAV
ncbi:MAG: sulfotransferase family 2 domain-containing protein [Pseudomonadota bacterium]